MTGDISEQCQFLNHGGGSNGKTTFITTVQSLLGDYAKQSAPDLLLIKNSERHPTELASLCGARFVVASETGARRSLREDLVKQFTGGDRITCRRMREDFWDFDPTHKLWLSTNHKPKI